MATLLTDGAGTLTSQAFRQRQEDAAASVGFSASLDRLGGSLRVLSANREEGFELLRLALTQPRFDADMIEQRRAQTIAAINQANQRPASVAARTLMETEFAGHPYANDPDGTPDDLRKLTQQTLKQRAAALLIRNGLVVAAVGDIEEADLARLLDRTFGTLPAGTPPALPPEWKPPTKARTVVVERPVPQSTALLALPGVARDDPDWYAALVMNHILGGGGQQSRLFTEVREKRGLAYGASSSLRVYKRAALLVMSTASANERVAEALARGQGRAGAASRRRPDRAGDRRRQDLSRRRAGAVARFVGRHRGPAAFHAGRQPRPRPSHQARRPDRGGQDRRCPPPRPPPVARRGADHGRRRQAGRHHLGSAVSKILTRQYLSPRRRA